MKTLIKLILTAVVLIGGYNCSSKQKEEEKKNYIKTEELRIRDPFVFVDQESNTYYVPASDAGKGFKLYKSKDLQNWEDLGSCFTPDKDFWGKTDFWAPDLYQYNGKYYIFGTFSDTEGIRGTSILVSENVEGPYEPLVNKPTTPDDWMALDGALYIDDNNQPWMLYCHEWLQVDDGEMVAQRLSPDLKEMEGEPIILFSASSAPWTIPSTHSGKDTYVTDAPVVYTTPGGRLVMLWSSFADSYRIAASYSDNGILGPWKHDEKALNNDDGGHSMLFTDLDGTLKISYHSPNSKTETATIKEVAFDENDNIYIK